jgi:hypothetical protein
MSSVSLRLCPFCARHARCDEARCPFCERSLEPIDAPSPAAPMDGLFFSRAAFVVAGSLALASCQSQSNIYPSYGLPPPHLDDSARGEEQPRGTLLRDAGVECSDGESAARDQPVYGAPPPPKR